MNKDVIYIDVEDDITAIIGKVKASKEKVVALVPPKRIGVLQSAVNLRLLARAAGQTDKHLALVTNNHALIALATSASIPVAKNLQSKPEMAEIPALKIDDDSEDIIEGAALPVGDHAGQGAPAEDKKAARNAAMTAALAEAPKEGETPKPKTKGKARVPNFDKFRKKLVLIIAGVVLLVGFLVWAIFFAPRATVVIKAKTTSLSVNETVSITTASTSSSKNIIKAINKTKTETKTVDFRATGSKDVGKKATGTVRFSTDSYRMLARGVTIPAGTTLASSSGKEFVTDTPVRLSLDTGPNGTSGVTAKENGSSYNAAEGAVSGAPNGVSADLVGATSGGVTKTVKVVTAADVQKARGELADEDNDSVRDELADEFADGVEVLKESFRVDYENVSSDPSVGAEADDGTLKATVKYVLYGVEKAAIGEFLDAHLKAELSDKNDQRVYKNGMDDAAFQEVSRTKNGARATLIATAQTGPEIKDEEVKEQVKGKRYGEIQASLESIQGVDDVDVKFFPFWVSSVPDDTAKITVEFNIDAK